MTSVAVVLVNFRGVEDTLVAVDHLERLHTAGFSVRTVVVDNASGDNSLTRLRGLGDRITLVESQSNDGFAGGCNRGVAAAGDVDFIAFLNNDARPDPAWLQEALGAFASDPRIGAVASRVLDWDGRVVDYIGSAMTWYGMGYKPFVGEREPSGASNGGPVLFGTGSAMVVRRHVFEGLGGFDERYFMFFEDVDLGWRLNLAGWTFLYVPSSLVFHKHHASMAGVGEYRENYLLERNALFTLFKNLDDDSLRTILPAALLLSIRRRAALSSVDTDALDLRRRDDGRPEVELPKEFAASAFALDRFIDELPGLAADRRRIQSTRTVSDRAIRRLFGDADNPIFVNDRLIDGYENLTEAFGLARPSPRRRVLVITGDPIGRRMSGPGIRAWAISQALSEAGNDVTLMTTNGMDGVEAPFEVVSVRAGDEGAFRKFERESEVIVFQGLAMRFFDGLFRSDKILVADVYDPLHLEQLEQSRELPRATWDRQVADATDVLNEQMLRADFLLCASERQKTFYLGQLAALGRLNPATYERDPHLDRLIAVVPFGIEQREPEHSRNVLKGIVPGIGRDDTVLVWGGGLYSWFDPQTLVRAIALLGETRPDVRLFFQGTRHPNPDVPEMAVVGETRKLAAELGVLDESVFFNDTWVDYDDRANFLLESDAAVSTHRAHIETTFSFRTRILDYLWAELPMVVTEGDHFADLVAREGLGRVVPAEDPEALATAIEQVLYDEPFRAKARENIRRVRDAYRWSVVLDPLIRFVDHPSHASDRVSGAASAKVARRSHRRGLRRDLGLVAHYLRNGGIAVVGRKVVRRLRPR